MTTSNYGIEFIKAHEELSLTTYSCSSDVCTIGWGSTSNVQPGDTITLQEAEERLFNDIRIAEREVLFHNLDINQNQFDALVSFVFNLGSGNFRQSTLLKKIKADPNDPDIAFQFSIWTRSNGKILRGLEKRRKNEAELYFTPIDEVKDYENLADVYGVNNQYDNLNNLSNNNNNNNRTSLTFTPTNNVPGEIPENKGIKYNIVNVFPKTIELDELSIPGKEKPEEEKQRPEEVISVEFPLVKINERIFGRDEIRSITIDCTDFLPKITLSVGLVGQVFLAKDMPKDGDIISVAIQNKSDVLKIIRNDYVITNVHATPNNTEIPVAPSFITFYGELFIPGLKSQKNDMAFNGTSYYAMQEFAKKYGLGFSSNEDNTNDKQIWLKANITGDIFCENTINRSWRDNASFYKCWVDLYYNLNFVNMNYQLMSAESEVDIAALISNVDKGTYYGQDTDEDQTQKMPKVFSNFQQFRTTPFYISTWRPYNRSSAVTFQVGTRMKCEMFEHNQNLFDAPDSSKYWAIMEDPTYDDEKTKKMILLRGRASYVNDEENPELRRANYPYVELYEKHPWLGIQYTISNPQDNNMSWDGNHHKNYHLARIKNLLNNKELDKLNLHLEVTGNNFNVVRGDKIPVALIRTNNVQNLQINPDINFNDALDLFYSGWYIVKGFKLNWTSSNEDFILSNFVHEFILTRREWPPPIPVDPIETTNNE